jgi:cytochrome P450
MGKDYRQRMDNTRPWWRERPSLARAERSMLNVDGPYHTRLRRLVSKVFTFRSVERMRPSIEAIVDELVDRFAAKGGGDLLSELAFPLPVTVIGELLGVPVEDREQFRDLVADLVAVFEMGATKEQFDAADDASRTIDEYFFDLIAQVRRTPGDDVLSRLVTVEADEDRLSDEELVTLATLLFAAGFETTTNLIGNTMIGFLRQPEQMALLRERPELAANLADEALRYDGTAQIVARQTKQDFPIDDVTIPAGQTVFIMIGAGNHDPARFSDPDSIDVTRTDIRPLSFGGGVHFCLGAALARAEIEIVFNKMFERFPSIAIDGDVPPYRDRLTLRGLSSLPLRFDEAQGRVEPLPEVARESVRTVAPVVPAGPEDPQELPPRPAGLEDARWRASYRERMERSPVYKSPEELASTIALLARVPIFAGCTVSELERLAATAYPIAFDPLDVLCSEGEDSPECYVVAEGEALVTIEGNIVATVEPDDVVGERGPIFHAPRAATVTATTHMVTYAISRDELDFLVDGSPAAADAMKRELVKRYG